MPDHARPRALVRQDHPERLPAFVANQFKGPTSRTLRQEFPHLRSRLPTLWSRSYFVATCRRGQRGDGAAVHRHAVRAAMAQGARPVRRAYKFRLYPTAGQATRAAQCLRDHQRLYNAALEERREAWRRRKVSIRYGQQSAQLKDIRAVTRIRAAGRSPPSRPPCAVWTRRWPRSTAAAKPAGTRLPEVQGAGPVGFRRVAQGRRRLPVEARHWAASTFRASATSRSTLTAREGWVKTISLKREGRRWYVVLSCDHVPTGRSPPPARDRPRRRRRPVRHHQRRGDHPQPDVSPRLCCRTDRRAAGPRLRRNADLRTGAGHGRRSPRRTAVPVPGALTSTTRPHGRSSRHAT